MFNAKEGIDVLHVSAGIYESLPTLLEPMSYSQGWRSYLAAHIKRAVKVPVITVGVVREPEFAEQLISENQADFVAVGRGLLADPDWPLKARQGRVAEIQRCIGCNEGCLNQRLTKSIQCSVNPETGREGHFKLLPLIKRPPKLVIVGGGIGCETALFLNQKGLDVCLFEQQNTLALDVEPITAWDLIERIEKAGIHTVVGRRVIDIKDNTIRLAQPGADGGQIEAFSFELFVWAGGRMSDQSLFRQIQQLEVSFDYRVIGDAKSVGKIHDAIYDGYKIISSM